MNALIQDFLDEDPDPQETREWIESIKAVIGAEGTERARQLVETLVDETSLAGGNVTLPPTTQYAGGVSAWIAAGTSYSVARKRRGPHRGPQGRRSAGTGIWGGG